MVQNNSVSSVADNMDAHLQAFLRDRANTLVKWDLIRFFHDNPHTTDTAENIARYTGREVTTVAAELDGLVESHVLERREVSQVKLYSLSTDAQMRELVQAFVLACDDRQFRIKAIDNVIRKMD